MSSNNPSSTVPSLIPGSGIAAPIPLPAFLSNAPTLAAPLPPHTQSSVTATSTSPIPSPVIKTSQTDTPSSSRPLQSAAKQPTPLPVTSQPKPPVASIPVEGSSGGIDDDGVTADGGGGSWVGWLKGTVSNVGQKVAHKAKSSMNTMITTLDPQMKEFLHSGGDMDLIVASDKEMKVSPVREAFQVVFGKATVSGMAPPLAPDNTDVAKQPVGLEACLMAAEHRINSIRSTGKLPHPSLPVLAVENCIVELSEGSWYDVGLLLLDDPYHDVMLQTYTQTTSIPTEWVKEAKAATAPDYSAASSGVAVTIGSIASKKLQVQHGGWHEAWCGVSRRDMLLLAARSLATLYREKLPQN